MIKKIYILLLGFLLFSCGVKTKFSYEEDVLKSFIDNDFLETNKCVVIIPAYGCGACTQDIIKFSKENYKNNKVKFIFVDLDKPKKILFKDIIDFEKYILIDKKSELVGQGLVDNKPSVFFIKNNHIEDIVRFDDSISDKVIERIKDSIE